MIINMNQGKDATLEPAYLAKRPMITSSSDIEELKRLIQQLQQEINIVEEDNRQQQELLDSINNLISELETEIDSNTTAINILNGSGEGSVTKTVADEIAKIIAEAPESFDTLKEISDWISNHSEDAAAMNSAIQQNASDISTLQNIVGDNSKGLVKFVGDNTSAIAILNGDVSTPGSVTNIVNNIIAGSNKVNAIALEDSEAIAATETDGFYFNLSDMKLYEKIGSQITESSKLMGFCVISKALFTENQEDLAELDTFFFVYS